MIEREADHLQKIVSQWGIQGTIAPIENRGYSGSQVYIVDDGSRKLILRKWTEYLIQIQKPLLFLQSQGFGYIPEIFLTKTGESIYFDGADYWELTSMVSGKNNQFPLNEKQAYSLGNVVGKFHTSLQTFEIDEQTKRDHSLEYLAHEDWDAWWKNLTNEEIAMITDWGLYEAIRNHIKLVEDVFTKHIRHLDWIAIEKALPKHMVHRDLWAEHVFFEGDMVSGLIDFGTIRYGRRLDDITRMLTEFSNWDSKIIKEILRGYYSIDSLEKSELLYLKEIVLLLGPLRGTYLLMKAVEEKNNFTHHPITLEGFIHKFTHTIAAILKHDFSKYEL